MKPTIYPSIHSFTVTTTASRDLVLMVMAGWLASAATRHSSICAATAFPNHWYPPEVLCTRGLTAFNLSLSRYLSCIMNAVFMTFKAIGAIEKVEESSFGSVTIITEESVNSPLEQGLGGYMA